MADEEKEAETTEEAPAEAAAEEKQPEEKKPEEKKEDKPAAAAEKAAAKAAEAKASEKAKLKAQIKGLKQKRADAVASKDSAQLEHARRNIKRLKQKLRQVSA